MGTWLPVSTDLSYVPFFPRAFCPLLHAIELHLHCVLVLASNEYSLSLSAWLAVHLLPHASVFRVAIVVQKSPPIISHREQSLQLRRYQVCSFKLDAQHFVASLCDALSRCFHYILS